VNSAAASPENLMMAGVEDYEREGRAGSNKGRLTA